MSIHLDKGVTRWVIIVWPKFVIKVPSLSSWKQFLQGLLANMQEEFWWKSTKDKRLCPTWFSICGGFMNIQPYCFRPDCDEMPCVSNYDGLPLDTNPNNFGQYNKQTVLFDYGS